MKLHARHGHFLLSLLVGTGLAGFGLALGLAGSKAGLLGFDSFALCYLVLMASHAHRVSGHDLRRHAEDEDEGIGLILCLAFGAVAASLTAIVLVLRGAAGPIHPAVAALAIAAVPLGWAMAQTLAAFRYAHMHYSPGAIAPLVFPDTPEPGPWDFLYFAFTIGMTAQTSDVTLATSVMRRAVLAHSVLAFFYNTVILALAVNAGVVLAN